MKRRVEEEFPISDSQPNTICVVLVRPEESGNIGSACRAMKTMGITRLRIVDPLEYDTNQIRYMAVHAADIWERVEYFPNLAAAVADCSLSAGISRRRGKRRKYFAMYPEDLAEHIMDFGNATVALVFGNEQHGLTHAELSLCDVAVSIPAAPDFPSLNLSHAVQIITYAIFRAGSRPSGYSPIDRRAQERLSNSLCESLRGIGFFTYADSADMERFLREIIARTALHGKEAHRLDTMFKKIRSLSQNYNSDSDEADE